VLGGVESILAAHARLLAEAGHRVRVVAGRGDCEIVPELDSRHPEVEAATRRLAAGDDAAAEIAGLAERIGGGLRPLLAESDLVIAHNVMTMPFNLPLATALAGSGRPILAWTHDLAWSDPRHRAFHREGAAYALLHQPVAGVRYTAISERVRLLLAETYGVAAEVVPNGIDRAALLRIRPSTLELLEAAGALAEGPLVLVPFRITRRKRLELALRAVAVLADRRPGLRLVVSGPLGPHSGDNDSYWAEVVELRRSLGLEGRAIFLRELGEPHPVDDEMVAELYQLAAAVLLTSESEGFGLPVLEAGLARVPVVCSDLAVFREIAGDDAFYYPVDSPPEGVADQLEAALDSPTARLQARIGSRYDWSAVLPRIEEEIRFAAG
jgi:glycosyltransferase involved in cell wall biosynthesis